MIELPIKGTWEEFLTEIRVQERIKTAYRELIPSILADLFAKVESQDLRVDKVLMNAFTFSSVRKWGRDVLDIETDSEKIMKGFMAKVWGGQIIVTKKVPDLIVLAVNDTEEIITGAILELAAGTVQAKEIVELKDKLVSLSSDLQSLVDRAIKTLDSIVTVMDRNQ